MKFVARLRFNIVDGLLVEDQKEHYVLVSPSQEPTNIYDLSEEAKRYIVEHVEVDRLVNGQWIILMLAGTLQYVNFPTCNDWAFDLDIDWASLEIIPMVPFKGIKDV